MHILTIIFHSWLLFSMAFFGGSKIAGAKHQVDLFDSIKLPQWFRVQSVWLSSTNLLWENS
ncbi:hypothetical protein LJR153_005079 [Paenibacillus sp. LjRoot153]|uniref:hypothetical protein n=1 Tax=Paenibacillus sp. LjRoot153 TaxID=3342270 RepID=UPI003ECCE817